MGYEDVDYCLRVFQAGFPCVYEPAISAIHHESLFRSRPEREAAALARRLSIAHLRAQVGAPARRRARRRACDGRALRRARRPTPAATTASMLPALALGCDWCGLDAPPPQSLVGRGERARGSDGQPDFASYEVARRADRRPQDGWLDLIPRLQASGTRVFCDIDYDLHAFEPAARGAGAGRGADRACATA